MLRRLYYLVPDAQQAAQLRADLNTAAIAPTQFHAVTRDKTAIAGIADMHTMDETDGDERLEWRLWRINHMVFFLALAAVLGLALWAPSSWLWLPVLFMAGSFAVGAYFTLRVPNLHWRDLLPALQHGEAVVMKVSLFLSVLFPCSSNAALVPPAESNHMTFVIEMP